MGCVLPQTGYSPYMRYEGEIGVRWSWAELSAVREAVELTPSFAGRDELRTSLRRRPNGQGKAVKLRALQAHERERGVDEAAAA